VCAYLDENCETVLQIQAPEIHTDAFHAPVLPACLRVPVLAALAALVLALKHIHPVALQVVVILGAEPEQELGMLRLQLRKLPLRRRQERLVAVAG
jgi:hypothetical protein